MIPVTRRMGALTQTLLQVALVLPKKGSASLAMQEFARSVPCKSSQPTPAWLSLYVQGIRK